jgi:hypothetical protein
VTSAEDFAHLLRQAAASMKDAKARVAAARDSTADTVDEFRRAFDGSSNSSAEEAIEASRKALQLVHDTVGLLDKSLSDLSAYMSDVLGKESMTSSPSAGGSRPSEASESIGDAEPTKTDRLKEHVTDRDLDAARRELKGEVVARKPDGAPWDHVREVREAQLGLVNRINKLKRQLTDSRTADSDKAALEAELSEASRLLDHSERFVPRRAP